MKKVFVVAVILSVFMLFNSPVDVSAAGAPALSTWYTCNIISVGTTISSGNAYVALQLSDTASTPAFTDAYVLGGADDQNKNRILAAALTAMSLEKRVMIYCSLIGGRTVIVNLYVLN